jgi:AcrR family transcriptional regulator
MEQTLEVAHALFAERGYGPVTMDEVAAAVGVTKPLLYNYFGNKERLYLACMEPAGDALVAAVVGAVERTSTPQDALRAGIHAFFDFVDQDRSSWRVLFDETLPSEGGVARRVADYRARIAELVAGALLAQPSVSAVLEVQALSLALLGAAEALVRWWLHGEALSARETAELLIATVEPGLSARVAGPRDAAGAASGSGTRRGGAGRRGAGRRGRAGRP